MFHCLPGSTSYSGLFCATTVIVMVNTHAAAVNSWFSDINKTFETFMGTVGEFNKQMCGSGIMEDDFRYLVSVLANPAPYGFSVEDHYVIAFPDGATFPALLSNFGIADLMIYVTEWDRFLDDRDYLGFAAEAGQYRDMLAETAYSNDYNIHKLNSKYGEVFKI